MASYMQLLIYSNKYYLLYIYIFIFIFIYVLKLIVLFYPGVVSDI